MTLLDVAAINKIDAANRVLDMDRSYGEMARILRGMPESPERTRMLALLLENQEHSIALRDMVIDADAKLRGAARMLQTANEQLEAQVREYLTLEEAMENLDERNRLVADLAARIRQDDGVVPEANVWKIVARAFRDLLGERGVAPSSIDAFLEKVKYKELNGEMEDYLAQFIGYVGQQHYAEPAE